MSYTSANHNSRSMTLVQTTALAVGAVFVLGGILGFIPGVTTNLDDLKLFGHTSNAQLIGLFQVSILHNIVHLLYGVAGLAAGRASASAARGYLIGGGVVYLVLWLYGLVIGQGSQANFVPLNGADNWLHLGLGLGMIGLGFVASRATKQSR